MRLGDAAGAALEEQRHAVREAEELDRLVRGPAAAVGEADLDLERVAAVHLGRPRDRGDEVVVALDLLDAFLGRRVGDRLLRRRRRVRRRLAPWPPSPPSSPASWPPRRGRAARSRRRSSPSLSITFRKLTRPLLHQLVADGAQAVRGRAHELRGGDGLVQLLRHRAVLAEDARAAPASCPTAPWPGCRSRSDDETRLKRGLQEAAHVVALRLARHQHQRAQLDAVRVRLDLERFLGQLARSRAGS